MINIISPINQLGYGIAGLNIVKALSKITKVSLWPISQPQVTTKEDGEIIQNCINNTQFPHFKAPCLRIWHQHDMSQFVGKGKHIGFPIFELDTFSELEKHHLSYPDKIFVCSNWAKNIILDNISISSDNVCVVPLAVDNSVFSPSPNNLDGPTIFFNCGKWEIRKGHDILVDIFNKAFSSKDNVQLWMMNDNPFLTEDESNRWRNLYYSSKLGTKIRLFPRLGTQKEVYNIMCQTDCGIFPSRAEGWNLELLEMMACGKSVITTNYAAHTEFCNNNNSLLVPINDIEPAYDGKWFFKQGNWAKITQQECDLFIDYMRDIHSKKQSHTLPTNIGGIETATQFSWQNTAEIIRSNV